MEKQIFPASISNLDRIMTYYRQIMENSGITSAEAKKFELALEEATVNIISYAYKDPVGMLEIEHRVRKDSRALDIQLKDTGRPFNPCNLPEVLAPTDLHSQDIGGLGIHFMRKMADRIEYSYIDNMNVLTLTKNLTPQGS